MVSKLKYLRDTFSGVSLDTSLWTVTGPGLSFFNQSVQFTPSSTNTILESVDSYSLTESEVEAYFALLGPGETREMLIECRIDSSNSISIQVVNNTITFRVRVAGVNSD